ncbi:MAG: FtsW/RodA/SpoVE family cell cycle protein [Flavobacteriales bacterium]|nr:FtsW/RodA/SpoVE family cell cycle protein [Flavobacteriales bacterium]MCB9449368.1 FtsW/RodA/SpoVE family cell cycle protein [Flavobacteriales bacterium]
MHALTRLMKGDRVIWAVVFLLSLFSLLAVYSSTGTLAFKYQEGNTEYYLIKHLLLLIAGFGIIILFHTIRYTYYSRLSQIAIFISIPLLLITLLMGTNLNSADRWLTLPGVNLTFQTSDLAKLALIIYVARLLSKKQHIISNFKEAFIPIMLPICSVCALILPADFSTAAILFVTCMLLMFLGGMSIKYLLGVGGAGILLGGILLVVLFTVPESSLPGRSLTWKRRLQEFGIGAGREGQLATNHAENSYQVQQSKIAIAAGGFLPKGPGTSRQRNFLPHPYSDFIYAIIIEEYGSIIGGGGILLLYLILLYRVILLALKNPGSFGSVLAMGCGLLLIFQAMINMAVAVNIMPVTGQTLPLVSMGGTSILFTSAALGIILSVSREVAPEKVQAHVAA